MSTAANAIPASAATVPASIPSIRLFLWSVRREVWENRYLYLAPLAVAVLIVFATAINVIGTAPRLHMPSLAPMAQHQVIEEPFIFASALLMFSAMVVSVFYSVDALYGERRDRSLLFWKSMPVSDTISVLAKLSIPLLVLPLVTFAVTFVTQFLMLLLTMMRAGIGLASHLALFQMWWSEFFHLVAYHGLWWAPFWGWFLLASAYARRAPLLWAVLPPLVIGFGERIAFVTSHFADWLMFRFIGGMSGPPDPKPMSMGSLMPGTPLGFVTDFHVWAGFAMCAVCLALAVRLRRSRGPA